jgi:hypothetical protein
MKEKAGIACVGYLCVHRRTYCLEIKSSDSLSAFDYLGCSNYVSAREDLCSCRSARPTGGVKEDVAGGNRGDKQEKRAGFTY